MIIGGRVQHGWDIIVLNLDTVAQNMILYRDENNFLPLAANFEQLSVYLPKTSQY